jgi:hypothetical protein
VDEHVDGDAGLAQRVAGARRRDDHAGAPRGPQCGRVAAREVDGADVVERVPRQLVVAVRHQALAEDRDRALAVVGQVDEAASLDPGPRARMHRHALARELLVHARAEPVARERRQEQRAAGQLRHLHRRDGPAAGGLVPELLHVQDLAGTGQPRHDREVDPLDVADHRHARIH